jgi:hypothetical protein
VKHVSECESETRERVTPPPSGGVGSMGVKRSFRIESKRFDLVLGEKGSTQVKFTEIGKHHRCDIFTGTEGAIWLGRCVEENITREGEQAFIRTRGEHNKTYVIRRYSNNHGRYVEVTECGRGGSRGRIIIPEGQKHNGWQGFVKELKLLLSPEQCQSTEHGGAQSRTVERVESRTIRAVETKSRERKSYAKAVGGIGQELTATVKPVFRAPETRKEIITGIPGFQDVPKIAAPSKTRQPLRFFPDSAPVTENFFVRGGLTICLNDKGQRKVSWTPKEDRLKKAWVPCGPGSGLGKSNNKHEALMGPKARSTFEVGESSSMGMKEARVNPVDSTSGQGPDPVILSDPGSLNQPNKAEIAALEECSRCEVLERTEKVREVSMAATATWVDWSLIFKDGRRVVIPDFSASPWDSTRVVPHFNLSEMMVLPLEGGMTHGNSDEAILGDSLAGEPGMVVISEEEASDTLEISPLAVDFSLIEKASGNMGVMEEEVTTQQQLSDWVMGHLKKVGKALGASYEGNEEIVIGLLQDIEACRIQKGLSESLLKRGQPSAIKGLRELKGLVSTVNYEPRTPESRRSSRERALIVSQ